mmetsp:Transcript_23206/g.64874  ORF Transcript_23206/g.64874 Transcript_23206/m.64874 type:complete len:368 (-) Transcript_23206:209-1312(-)
MSHQGSTTHALMAGTAYGLINAIGPDHLCTVLTLVVSLSPTQAFLVGSWWGLGHTLGVCMLGVIFALAGGATHGSFNIAWEHWGNYLIGGSMVLLGLYYFAREPHYLHENEDGTIDVTPCECHPFLRRGAGPVAPPRPEVSGQADEELQISTGKAKRLPSPAADGRWALPPPESPVGSRSPTRRNHSHSPDRRRFISHNHLLCTAHACQPCNPLGDSACGAKHAECKGTGKDETSPLLEGGPAQQARSHAPVHSAAMGVIQGVCCPVGLAGLTAMFTYTTATQVLVFIAAYFTLSFFALAAVAAGWAWLVNTGTIMASQKLVYRASCSVTIVLGLAWMALNVCGSVGTLDLADRVYEQWHHSSYAKV